METLSEDESLYLQIARPLLPANSVVIDVGANKGNWTEAAKSAFPQSQFILFEPISYRCADLNSRFPNDTIIENHALSDVSGKKSFTLYSKDSFSSLHRRTLDIEEQLNLTYTTVPITCTTLDQYLYENSIRRVAFLKIDAEGSELEIIYGCKRYLRSQDLDFIQFEYEGTWKDAGYRFIDAHIFLEDQGYSIFCVGNGRLSSVSREHASNEQYDYKNYLAVSSRISPLLAGNNRVPIYELRDVARLHQTAMRGVIHVGAHKGLEVKKYLALGYSPIVMIEPNKQLLAEASRRFDIPGVFWVNCGASDTVGQAELHITTMDQSSSLLALKRHLDYYPDVRHSSTEIVDIKPLDLIIEELGLDYSSFSLLNIDVQGAEDRVLLGAPKILKAVDIVYTEINFEELYQDCALIEDIDGILDRFSFKRHGYRCPYHHSWGDAIYVKKPIITNRELGQNGQFANQIFQILFLDAVASEYSTKVSLSNWDYEAHYPNTSILLEKKNPDLQAKQVNVTEQDLIDNNSINTDKLAELVGNLHQINFSGYFQDPTVFGNGNEYIRRARLLFALRDDLHQLLDDVAQKIDINHGPNTIAIHYRLGDYGKGDHFVTPPQQYSDAIKAHTLIYGKPNILIFSDEPQRAKSLLEQSTDIKAIFTSAEILNQVYLKDAEIKLLKTLPDHILDFELLRRMRIVFISNSSFGFCACMLSTKLLLSLRPSLKQGHLIPFIPSDSTAILLESQPIPWFYKRSPLPQHK